MSFNPNRANQVVAFNAEMDLDPEGVGYAAVRSNTKKLLELWNLESNNPQVNDTVNIPLDEFLIVDVIHLIDSDEYNALLPVHKMKVDAIAQSGVAFPAEDSAFGAALFGPVKPLFRKAFNNLTLDPPPANNESKTWLAIKDDKVRHASRAEVLFGKGTIITQADLRIVKRS